MTLELKAKSRTVPTPILNQTRAQGQIPAELYGAGQANQHLFIDLRSLEKIYKQAGRSVLVDLIVDKKEPVKIIIGEVQKKPVTDQILHVDFRQIQMDKEMQTKIPLVFIGESRAIKEMGGTLIKSLEELEIVCLPIDLISALKVNLEVLETFDDVIHVKDINIPEKIKVLTDLDQVVASVTIIKVEIKEELKEGEKEEEAVKVDEKEAKAEKGGAEDKSKTEEG